MSRRGMSSWDSLKFEMSEVFLSTIVGKRSMLILQGNWSIIKCNLRTCKLIIYQDGWMVPIKWSIEIGVLYLDFGKMTPQLYLGVTVPANTCNSGSLWLVHNIMNIFFPRNLSWGWGKECSKLFLQIEERYLTVDDMRKAAACLSNRVVLFVNRLFKGLPLCQRLIRVGGPCGF